LVVSHRGGFSAAELPAGLLDALRAEAVRENARLGIVADGAQQSALAGVVEAGDYVVRTDESRAREQAHWAPPPGSSRRDGVPPTAYPAIPDRTEPYFAGRDFARGHGWGVSPDAASGQTSAGVACLLMTRGDERRDWLQAGQALQRVLLLASSCGVSAALHSQQAPRVYARWAMTVLTWLGDELAGAYRCSGTLLTARSRGSSRCRPTRRPVLPSAEAVTCGNSDQFG